MHREALRRFEDARILAASNANAFSDSAHLLSLLGFELLLKLVYEVTLSSRAHGDNYHELFAALPGGLQQSLLDAATERIGPSSLGTDVAKILQEWAKNFVDLRYPYEKYEGMTEIQYRQLGEEWVVRDGPLEDATFRYYPEELDGMVHALRSLADDMANHAFQG